MRAAWLLLLALAISGSANAEGKLSLGPVAGDKKSALTKQLSASLCAAYVCTPYAQVLTKRRVDWKRAKRLGVTAIVSGKVAKKGKGQVLALSVDTGKGRPAALSYPLWRGELSADSLLQLRQALGPSLGAAPEAVAAPPPAPAPKPEPAPAPPPEPKPEPAPAPAPAPAPKPEPKPEPKPKPAPKPAPVAKTEEEPLHLYVGAGVEITNRTLSYDALKVENLRTYEAPVMVSPRVEAAIYPLAFVMDNLARGVGAHAAYQQAVGLTTLDEKDTPHTTRAARLEAGLDFRVQPLEDYGLVLDPFADYSRSTFTVGAASDGSLLAGVPGLTESAVRLGAEVEAPILPVLSAVAQADYRAVLSAPDLLSNAYFPRGSAWGVDAELGVAVHPMRLIELRAVGRYSRTAFHFQPQANDTYQADGATEQTAGGQVLVRVRY